MVGIAESEVIASGVQRTGDSQILTGFRFDFYINGRIEMKIESARLCNGDWTKEWKWKKIGEILTQVFEESTLAKLYLHKSRLGTVGIH
jgi:hypothetical protein